MRQGTGIVEIGLADFSSNQSIDRKGCQGNRQKGPPNPRHDKAFDHLVQRIHQHIQPALDKGKQIMAANVFKAFR